MKKKAPEKRVVRTSTGYEIYPSDFEVTLKDAITKLTELAVKYGEDAVLDYGDHCTYEEASPTFMVFTSKLETDQQFEHRVVTEQSREDAVLACQEAEYNRLKKLLKKG